MSSGRAGRPKNFRPMAGSAAELRALAVEALAQLEAKTDAPSRIRLFTMELLYNFLELDAETTADLTVLKEKIAESPSIADPTKVWLRIVINKHDIADAQLRMQIFTILSDAMVGKPPEATHRGRSLQVPGGAAVPIPRAADLRIE